MIQQMVENWMEWMLQNAKAVKGDGRAAFRAENLIDKKYKHINAIDRMFEDALKRPREQH